MLTVPSPVDGVGESSAICRRSGGPDVMETSQ
jgi:hypothetical protein